MPDAIGITITSSPGIFLANRNTDSLLTAKSNQIAMYREWTAAGAVNRCGTKAPYQMRTASLGDVDTGFCCLPLISTFVPLSKVINPMWPWRWCKMELAFRLILLKPQWSWKTAVMSHWPAVDDKGHREQERNYGGVTCCIVILVSCFKLLLCVSLLVHWFARWDFNPEALHYDSYYTSAQWCLNGLLTEIPPNEIINAGSDEYFLLTLW